MLNAKPNAASWAVLGAVLLAGCAVEPVAPPTDLPEIRPGYVAGYLQPDQLPDTVALLPPPRRRERPRWPPTRRLTGRPAG